MYSCKITGQYRLDYFFIGTDYNGWTGQVWKTKSIQIFDTSVFSTRDISLILPIARHTLRYNNPNYALPHQYIMLLAPHDTPSL